MPNTPPLTPPWSFNAGHLALDFANTADWHASKKPEELLNSHTDLVDWAVDFGILTFADSRLLKTAAKKDPPAAKAALGQAIRLREAIYRVFDAYANGGKPGSKDLDTIRTAYAAAIHQADLGLDKDLPVWAWDALPKALDRMLWPIAAATIDLLFSEDLPRVGQCRDDRGCGALFLDTSRNHSRQWCRMESCGNRAKARRFYARERLKKS